MTCASTIVRAPPPPTSILPNTGLRLTFVASVSVPPALIASIAFLIKLWNTCTSRSSSPRIGGRLGSYRRTTLMRLARAPSSLSRATRSSSWCRLSGTGRTGAGRARLSSISMMRLTRSTSVVRTVVYSARRRALGEHLGRCIPEHHAQLRIDGDDGVRQPGQHRLEVHENNPAQERTEPGRISNRPPTAQAVLAEPATTIITAPASDPAPRSG